MPGYSSTHLLIYSSTHLLIYSSTHLLIYSSTHLLIYSSTHVVQDRLKLRQTKKMKKILHCLKKIVHYNCSTSTQNKHKRGDEMTNFTVTLSNPFDGIIVYIVQFETLAEVIDAVTSSICRSNDTVISIK